MTEGHPYRRLEGEADPSLYRVVDDHGQLAKVEGVVFPIVKADARRRIELIGTGFFISTNGLFVTAKHVLLDVFDETHQQTHAIAVLQLLPQNQYRFRPVLRSIARADADVAVGVVAPMRHKTKGVFTNRIVTLTTEEPNAGDIVFTYAYPNTAIIRTGSTQCHGALQNRPRMGASKPASDARTAYHVATASASLG